MAKRVLEDVFVTSGVPEETFVPPSNFNQVLLDIRHPGRPVVIEGPSGTGKTCTVKKVLEKLGKATEWLYLAARKADDVGLIANLAESPSKGVYIIDDFHRLHASYKSKLSDIAKLAAEESDPERYPKLVLVGINQVGTALIHFSPDIAKRCGIHRIPPATPAETLSLVQQGCGALNINFANASMFHEEGQGDYWLTQTLCKTACALAGILEAQDQPTVVTPDLRTVRQTIVSQLEAAYYESVKDFCRGRRFRPSNDPYYRILRFIATRSGSSSSVDLVELANANPEIAGSINNVKDARLSVLLKDKEKAGQYFYYNRDTARFSIEDPAVFYFLKNLDWERLRSDCGFRDTSAPPVQFDVAISFAGERREIAQYLAMRLRELDVGVFFDEDYEAKFLGRRLGTEFERVFASGSRFVVALLDKYHREKVWPTFERDVFVPRVSRGEVIGIFLDDTVFPGIPNDLYGVRLKLDESPDWKAELDKAVLKIIDRIG